MDLYNPSPSARTKGNWSAEEDRRLARLVQEHGEGSWSFIARHFAGRIGKQCRERWHNQLRPDIKRDAWDDAEEQLLIEAHQKLGNKWSDIAKLIPGRTENAVKNHWNATLRRKDASGFDGRPLTRLKQYMKNAAAGNKRRGNRNKREKRSSFNGGNGGGEEGSEIADAMKRQRLQHTAGAGAADLAVPNLGGDRAKLQGPILDLHPLPREETHLPFNLAINPSHRHSSSNSEADQILEWLTNSAAVGGAADGGGGESNIGGLDDVSALKFPFHGDTSFPAFPPFPISGQGGLSLGGREAFFTPEPPLLASPLISPSKPSYDLGYPNFMHGLGNIEHPALHSFNNLSALPNHLRPSSFGGERSKSAASSRSAAPIQGATTALVNVPITNNRRIKKNASSSLNRDSFALPDEGAGFFSPPPTTQKVQKMNEDQHPDANGRQRHSKQGIKSRQVAPHAFLSPDSATSPAS